MPVGGAAERPGAAGLPAIDELNAMPQSVFVSVMAPLFEGAPRFLARSTAR